MNEDKKQSNKNNVCYNNNYIKHNINDELWNIKEIKNIGKVLDKKKQK